MSGIDYLHTHFVVTPNTVTGGVAWIRTRSVSQYSVSDPAVINPPVELYVFCEHTLHVNPSQAVNEIATKTNPAA